MSRDESLTAAVNALDQAIVDIWESAGGSDADEGLDHKELEIVARFAIAAFLLAEAERMDRYDPREGTARSWCLERAAELQENGDG